MGEVDRSFGKELRSWKEIAELLEVTVRTAQRWEKEKGLPVRRDGPGKGHVVADAAELLAWREAGDLEDQSAAEFLPQPKRVEPLLVYAAAVTFALLGVLAWMWIHADRTGPPSEYRVTGKTLQALDDRGRPVWVVKFPDELLPQAYDTGAARVLFEDIDGDGEIETLFSYQPATRRVEGTELICFSQKGREKWRFRPGRGSSEGTKPEAYIVADFLTLPGLGERGRRVVMVSNHATGDEGHVEVLTAAGKRMGEYRHSGRLLRVQRREGVGVNPDEFLAGGSDREKQCATLLVLDASAGTGLIKEKMRIFFPNSCMSGKVGGESRVSRIALARDGAVISVRHKANCESCDLMYTLNHNFKVTGLEVPEQFTDLHNELAAQGALDHKLSDGEITALRQIDIASR